MAGHYARCEKEHKQLPFYFYELFEGATQFHRFPHSHGNISYLQNGKEARKSK